MFVTSEDGTRIAVSRSGSGRPVVIVGGAFMTAASTSWMADALISEGFDAVRYDRRARGASGDTPPYAPEREVEDLRSVVDAVGEEVALLGHSSGAILALLAAASGVDAHHLFLSEPPFGFGDGAHEVELAGRMQKLLDEDRPEDVVSVFQREIVGLSGQLVEQIRRSPIFADLVPLAQSVIYDTTLTGTCSTPSAAMLSVSAPVTVLRGSVTFPFLEAASEKLSGALPNAHLVVVEESVNHDMHPAGTARAVGAALT